MGKVLKIINYKKSTISSLENLLNYFGIKNNLNNYLSSLSKYNHIDMERIYELTRTQERFKELIPIVANEMNLPEIAIEKDYFYSFIA